jgi:hypothetical protein
MEILSGWVLLILKLCMRRNQLHSLVSSHYKTCKPQYTLCKFKSLGVELVATEIDISKGIMNT